MSDEFYVVSKKELQDLAKAAYDHGLCADASAADRAADASEQCRSRPVEYGGTETDAVATFNLWKEKLPNVTGIRDE